VSSHNRVVDYAARDYFPPEQMRFSGWWFLLAQAPILVFIVLSRMGPIHVPVALAQPVGLAITIVGYGITFSIVLLASRRRGLGQLKSDYGWDVRPIDLIWGLAGVAVTSVLTVLIVGLLRPLGTATSNVHLGDNHVWNVINLFFVPVLIAAPIEELAFRGLLMRWIRNAILRGRTPPTDARRAAAIHLSVVVSAVCFALFHLYEADDFVSALNLGLQTFSLGIIGGYLTTYTGRLGPSVLTHGLHNALVGTLALTN
jgi:membrane protease YdiL (CAAX protease family)